MGIWVEPRTEITNLKREREREIKEKKKAGGRESYYVQLHPITEGANKNDDEAKHKM